MRPFYTRQPTGYAPLGDFITRQPVGYAPLGDPSNPSDADYNPAIAAAARVSQGVASAVAGLQLATRGNMFTHPRPNFWEPPHYAVPIETSSQPFVAYPAPGAAAATVLSYTVPNGYRGAIRWMAIVAVGGGFIDGTGNVIWRIQRNSVWVQGYENLTAQIGSWAMPNDAPLEVQENETYTVTVEVPAASAVQSGTTGARFRGWLVPLNAAVAN